MTELNNDLLRWIPTGSKMRTVLFNDNKTLKLVLGYITSAPPLTTKDIDRIDKRIRHDMDLFVKDVKTAINIKDVINGAYIHMKAEDGKITFVYEITLKVTTKAEAKKLAKLESLIDNYAIIKKFKYSSGGKIMTGIKMRHVLLVSALGVAGFLAYKWLTRPKVTPMVAPTGIEPWQIGGTGGDQMWNPLTWHEQQKVAEKAEAEDMEEAQPENTDSEPVSQFASFNPFH